MPTLSNTPQQYYDGNNYGNYQFISLTDIINQFMFIYVGEDKIIPKAKIAIPKCAIWPVQYVLLILDFLKFLNKLLTVIRININDTATVTTKIYELSNVSRVRILIANELFIKIIFSLNHLLIFKFFIVNLFEKIISPNNMTKRGPTRMS